MAFRRPNRSAEFFLGSPIGDNAAPYASKTAAAVRSPIDERERQSNLDIANIQADVLNTRAEEEKDTLKVRSDAANKLNKAKINANQNKGFFGLAKGIVGAALPLIASSDRRIKNTIEELDFSYNYILSMKKLFFVRYFSVD